MPIYSYKCNDCGSLFDELILRSDEEPEFCKHCNSVEIERAVTAHGGIQGSFGTVPKSNAGSYKK